MKQKRYPLLTPILMLLKSRLVIIGLFYVGSIGGLVLLGERVAVFQEYFLFIWGSLTGFSIVISGVLLKEDEKELLKYAIDKADDVILKDGKITKEDFLALYHEFKNDEEFKKKLAEQLYKDLEQE